MLHFFLLKLDTYIKLNIGNDVSFVMHLFLQKQMKFLLHKGHSSVHTMGL